ncbi:argininosuccinate synthase [Candidatus Woesearchaeota archaeon]|nr:argininosuccinate synthase [Candidatus Woesearchaeota archaeon]
MKDSDKQKVVLAYSGGLDTSVILKWLIDKGYDVIAYIADVGQDEDFKAAEKKALDIGASKVYIEDLKKEFLTGFVFKAVKANAVYEGKYLLGTSLARPLIAKKQIEIAKKEKTNIVAHGSTGKGNDQVRFELAYYTLMPDVKIISPWKDEEFLSKFQGRSDMIDYCKKNNILVKVTAKKPYSTDPNLMHVSYESGILEDVSKGPSEEMFETTVSPLKAPDMETEITIEFKKGIPVKVVDKTNNVTETDPLKLFTYLNKVGGSNGIGRVDLVENRFVGMKSRGVYETPGGTILMSAHLDIEGITMDKEVKQLRDSLIPKIASLIYNGFWYSPELELLMTMVDKSQENITGKVNVKLYKGNVIITGRSSPCSLYDEKTASMEEHGNYDQKDAKGFIKLNALRLKAWAKKKQL